MTLHFMLDIETLGQDTNAVVLSAAVLAFNPVNQNVTGGITFLFDPEDQKQRTIDFDTVSWWVKQSPEASSHWLSKERPSTPTSLLELNRRVEALKLLTTRGAQDVRWWAKSPSFDKALMESLYRDFGLTPPWGFRDWRDVRTVSEFLKDKSPIRPEIPHDPLSDAEAQAKLVMRFYREQGRAVLATSSRQIPLLKERQ